MVTPHHKQYGPLGLQCTDGRPLKATALELWKLALQRKSVILVACLLLIACFIFNSPTFCSKSLISYGPDEQLETQPEPSTQESVPLPLASDVTRLIDFSVGKCNIWRGDWIPHPHEPAYTNASCPFIQDTQNCIRNGRPDLDFLHWRWKPQHCELPLFDAEAFLKIVAGKKWAFIGDSIARNSLQSVLCLLSQVEMPEYTSDSPDFYFRSYNFTISLGWSPFLVKFTEDEAQGIAQGIPKLHVDVVEQIWAPSLHTYDYIYLSAGQWHLRPSLYLVQNKPVGCHSLPTSNVSDVGYGYGYRYILRTVFDYLISSEYKGVVFFKTFAPPHWENAPWDRGGNCTRKTPFHSNYVPLEGWQIDMYKIQLEEFAKTVQRSSEYSFKLKIMDVTLTAVLRPDAHPGPYGHFHPKAQNDCLHWCLPGAVDSWSAMLLDVLRHL